MLSKSITTRQWRRSKWRKTTAENNEITRTDTNATGSVAVRKVVTARLEPPNPKDLSTIQVGTIDVPELGGNKLMVGVCDGNGVGAIALFDAADLGGFILQLLSEGEKLGFVSTEALISSAVH